MPVSAKDWLLFFLVCMLLPAVISYFCGCINGAILISTRYFQDDVRDHGSGNAGLTNFYRNYGKQHLALVIVLDALKMVAAVWVTGLFLGQSPAAKLWGGLFCILGHMFPVTYHFHGGKGILSSSVLLLLLDVRIGLLVLGVFALLVGLTGYVSLGSVTGAVIALILICLFYPGQILTVVFTATIAFLVIWAHRRNIVRLLKGTESKLKLKK